MKPKSVVTCLPSDSLEQSLTFYRDCFQLPDLEIEEGMFVVELGNLSLFVMSKASFEEYTRQIGLDAGFPHENLQSLHSCAVESRMEIDHVFATAGQSGGSVAKPVESNQWGQEIGYIRDPDGHVWELVLLAQSGSGAG